MRRRSAETHGRVSPSRYAARRGGGSAGSPTTPLRGRGRERGSTTVSLSPERLTGGKRFSQLECCAVSPVPKQPLTSHQARFRKSASEVPIPSPELVYMTTGKPLVPAEGRPRSRSEISVASQANFAEPDETLVILDWDDTLCPSYWAKNLGYNINEDVTNFQHKAILNQVAAAAESLLKAARSVGNLVIVTNAETGWVELSCKRWMPALLPAVAAVQTVSARSTWEPTGLQSPFDWKEQEFSSQIRKFYSRKENQSWKNVVSVGDSPHERQALRTVTKAALKGKAKSTGLQDADPRKHCRTKTVKFKVRPTPQEVIAQLRGLSSVLETIVTEDADLDLAFLFVD